MLRNPLYSRSSLELAMTQATEHRFPDPRAGPGAATQVRTGTNTERDAFRYIWQWRREP